MYVPSTLRWFSSTIFPGSEELMDKRKYLKNLLTILLNDIHSVNGEDAALFLVTP